MSLVALTALQWLKILSAGNKAQRPTMRPQEFLGISSYRDARMQPVLTIYALKVLNSGHFSQKRDRKHYGWTDRQMYGQTHPLTEIRGCSFYVIHSFYTTKMISALEIINCGHFLQKRDQKGDGSTNRPMDGWTLL